MKQTTTTDEQGNYAFPVLPVGQFEIDITADGFKPQKRGGLAVDINAAPIADVALQLKHQNMRVTVTGNGARVETSDTQLGQVIESKQVTGDRSSNRAFLRQRTGVLSEAKPTTLMGKTKMK